MDRQRISVQPAVVSRTKEMVNNSLAYDMTEIYYKCSKIKNSCKKIKTGGLPSWVK